MRLINSLVFGVSVFNWTIEVIIIEKEPVLLQGPQVPMRDLPGFYFDPVRKRYFPVSQKRNHLEIVPATESEHKIRQLSQHPPVIMHLRRLDYGEAFRRRLDQLAIARISFPRPLGPVNALFPVVEGVEYITTESSDAIKFAYSVRGQLIYAPSLDNLVLVPPIHPLHGKSNTTGLVYNLGNPGPPKKVVCRSVVPYEPIQEDRSDLLAIMHSGRSDVLVDCMLGEVLEEFGQVTAFRIIDGFRLVGTTGGRIFVKKPGCFEKAFQIQSAAFAFFPHPLPGHFILLTMHGDFYIFSCHHCEKAFALEDLPIDSREGAFAFLGGLEPVTSLFIGAFRNGTQVLVLDLLQGSCTKVISVEKPIQQLIILPKLILVRL